MGIPCLEQKTDIHDFYNMNYLRLYTVLLPLAFLMVGCSQTQQKKETVKTEKKVKVFTLPEIPVMLTSLESRTGYLAAHYWEHFDFRDTALISTPEITEQALVDFLDILSRVDRENADKALTSMMDSASLDSGMFVHFISLTEKYLYEPNSPFRNEDFYMVVLRQVLKSGRLTDNEKLRPADRLKQANKNRPGMKAADFSYIGINGKQGKLSSLNSLYTLLFFYEPDCGNCKESEKRLAANPGINQAINEGKLKILAVYSGPDQEEWKNTLPYMPVNWIVVHNVKEEIIIKGLYEIRATPTLYLLDKNKRVILKDATEEETLELLAKLIHPS